MLASSKWMLRNGSATSGRITGPIGGIAVGAWNLQVLTALIVGRMQIEPTSSPLTLWALTQLAEMTCCC